MSIKKIKRAYNIFGHERGVIIKKVSKFLIFAMVMLTIFFNANYITSYAFFLFYVTIHMADAKRFCI